MDNIFKTADKNWLLAEDGYKPSESGHYETLFTLSNGYIGIRGVKDLCKTFFRKGTFIAGAYDKSDAQVIELVNCPDFFNYDIFIENVKLDMEELDILCYKRILDMKKAVLHSYSELAGKDGKRIEIRTSKLVSIANKHISAFSAGIKCINFSADIRIATAIDGNTVNIDSQSNQAVRHYKVSEAAIINNKISALKINTKDKNTEMDFLSNISVHNSTNTKMEVLYEGDSKGNMVIQAADFFAEQGKEYVFEKVIYSQSSLNKEQKLCDCTLYEAISRPFLQHLSEHAASMEQKWKVSDIIICGDDRIQAALRFNIFSLIMLGANLDGSTNIGAKGLHGEGYKGHVFWDTEIFMLPFYIYNDAKAAKKLLLYRYNRLQDARQNALEKGFEGAKFPWESADDGREVTPEIIFLPDGTPTRCWTGDEEIHVTGDIAFAFYEYYRITGDKDFYYSCGAEVILETAKYWESRLLYNSNTEGFEIKAVIGPDEFHIHVDNNFYTNYMARWNLCTAAEIWEQLRDLYPDKFEKIKARAGLTDEKIKGWLKKANMLSISKSEGVVEQFDNFFKLKDCVITEYRHDGMPILPHMFKNELDFKEYQLIKQPDVVMIMHLFNHEFTYEQKRINYEYYEKRTTHISSLSPSICCLMGIDIRDTAMAGKYFDLAANTDIDDNQGNTEHGIHAASLGGAWQAAVFGFGGFRIKNGVIHLAPWLPDTWRQLEYNVCWQGRLVQVKVTKDCITVRINDSTDMLQADNGSKACGFKVVAGGKEYLAEAGMETRIELKN
ncbi:kojibiose phosphorylase [Ruminiclostridium sufflavum DSM 19573]|uniref:Kojibiose phosphorylase n=1 Tax=Ruminiclostridium sufflavum DSM 19573 TaxID=1121337 RepID=A0A318XL38_9FIRM|nr:glycosyl hydrolase family 65 protein [Ruminiclostridium sufflavum]PYG88243.1 kojibiose phosphorylase [Ruminiclostridium sufflavum DSM 19573]